MLPTPLVSLDDIEAARERIRGHALRTPLLRLHGADIPGEIYLKLENLQPIGSFKLRGAANAMLQAGAARLAGGVWTPSAGNMAQGVGWMARALGVPCRVLVPDTAPAAKRDAVARLGAQLVSLPHATWWRALATGEMPASARGVADEVLVHSVADPRVVAGNGTIGLEILDDLPDVDTVLVPFGGGGLVTGIATALRALRPRVHIFACEIETAAPLGPSLAAGAPQTVPYRPSFVDGIGAPSLVEPLWPLVRELVDGALVATVEATAAAVRLLATRAHVVAEGAGAVPLAVACAGQVGSGKTVCIVSGGNLDPRALATILAGGVP